MSDIGSKRHLRIGIVDYHGDFRRIITDIIPRGHQVVSIPVDSTDADVDLLVNHHDETLNNRFNLPFFVAPYGTVLQHHVDGWNRNQNCMGILDLSGDILRRFPMVERPLFVSKPFFPTTPVYESAGAKVISLIPRYQERFPEAYELATSLTEHVYGDPIVPDIEALREAKWLLHIKPSGGFVCNAVMKALACGVPVIMDEKTWDSGFFRHYVRHGENALVVPADQIGEVISDLPDDEYQRIKGTCVAEASEFKRGYKWSDSWWQGSKNHVSLAQLDAIPYESEKGERLNPVDWERTEQIDARHYVRPDHQVLELGGCYGVVSCVINQILNNPECHVVVEPEQAVIPALRRNRDAHQAHFQIFNGIVARQPTIIKGEGLSRWTESSAQGNIPNLTFNQIEQRFGTKFTCLVADCEGGLERFIRDFPEFADNIDTILFERDREYDDSGTQCDYGYVEKFLLSKSFHQIKRGSHPVWRRFHDRGDMIEPARSE
ncbi:MAG: hypothetical protein KDB00_13725 [Planctomycetales bacterium]|nr:hypothetical protein [Planctomycetales bacterium]